MGTNWGNGQHVRAVWIKEALLNEVGGGTIWTFENLPISQLDNYLLSLLLGMRSPNANNFAPDLKYNIKIPGFFLHIKMIILLCCIFSCAFYWCFLCFYLLIMLCKLWPLTLITFLKDFCIHLKIKNNFEGFLDWSLF